MNRKDTTTVLKTACRMHWTKRSWDLPAFGSPEFNSYLRKIGKTLDEFKQSPVYKHAVRKGLIKEST